MPGGVRQAGARREADVRAKGAPAGAWRGGAWRGVAWPVKHPRARLVDRVSVPFVRPSPRRVIRQQALAQHRLRVFDGQQRRPGAEPLDSGRLLEMRANAGMAARDNPKARGKRRGEKCCPGPVFGIDAPAHEKAAPNPGAVPLTAAVRPAFSISSGTATLSSSGHSCVRRRSPVVISCASHSGPCGGQVVRSRHRQSAVSGQSDVNSVVAAMEGGTVARSCAV